MPLSIPRRFVEPRIAPIGNSFAEVGQARAPSQEVFERSHTFGDFMPHSLSNLPTRSVAAKERSAGSAEEDSSCKARWTEGKAGKTRAVQRPTAPFSSLRRRRTTGSCKVAQDPDADVDGDAVCCVASIASLASLASESTAFGPDGMVSSVNSLATFEGFSRRNSAGSVGDCVCRRNSTMRNEMLFLGGPPSLSEAEEQWLELERESRQLAEATREAVMKRLSGNAGVSSAGLIAEGELPAKELPTLLTSRQPRDAAVGRRASSAARVAGLAADAAAAVAKLPVLLGARVSRRPSKVAASEEDGAPLALRAAAEAWGGGDARARETRSMGASARATYVERQRRISQRFERVLTAFNV